VKPSLRTTLADSHVALIAIAVLLFWSLDCAFWALGGPLYRAASFLFTGVTILDFPFFSRTLNASDRFTLFITLSYLFDSLVYLSAAMLLSRWVYGRGPFHCLSKYQVRQSRATHV
jgi:hypothetical protein